MLLPAGAGIVGPGLTPVVNFHAQLQNQYPAGDSSAYAAVRSLSEERELNDITQRLDATDLNRAQLSPNTLHLAGLANGDMDKAGGAATSNTH